MQKKLTCWVKNLNGFKFYWRNLNIGIVILLLICFLFMVLCFSKKFVLFQCESFLTYFYWIINFFIQNFDVGEVKMMLVFLWVFWKSRRIGVVISYIIFLLTHTFISILCGSTNILQWTQIIFKNSFVLLWFSLTNKLFMELLGMCY